MLSYYFGMMRARANSPADVLALGFGAATAMWTVGYLARLPAAMDVPAPPSALLFFAFVLIGLAAGGLVGLFSVRGWRGGLAVGGTIGLINLLILGSLLSREDLVALNWGRIWWVPASVVAAMMVGAIGAAAGALLRSRRLERPAEPAAHSARLPDTPWNARFAAVAAGATLVLLAIGGAVTGADAGLAVVDWPNSFGYNMFLYPLSRMTGGIYLEHSHRLFGTLVGLTVLVLAIYLQRYDPRRWMKGLGWLALVLVIVQGVLGGLRVTGRPTLSDSPLDTSPNLYLAIVHGVLGQVFFALLVGISILATRAWQQGRRAFLPEDEDRTAGPAGPTESDVALSYVLLGALIVQLILGALVRHFSWSAHMHPNLSGETAQRLEHMGQWALGIHIVGATLVTVLAMSAGMRAWGLYERLRPLHGLGLLLMILVGVQLGLGILAYVVTGDDSPHNPPGAVDIFITTAHQTTGALLMATAAATALWMRRLALPSAARATAEPTRAPLADQPR